jgi:hypothetical protein
MCAWRQIKWHGSVLHHPRLPSIQAPTWCDLSTPRINSHLLLEKEERKNKNLPISTGPGCRCSLLSTLYTTTSCNPKQWDAEHHGWQRHPSRLYRGQNKAAANMVLCGELLCVVAERGRERLVWRGPAYFCNDKSTL